jgi:O-antigen ligase
LEARLLPIAAWGSLIVFIIMAAARGGKFMPVCLAGESLLLAAAGAAFFFRGTSFPEKALAPFLALAALQFASTLASLCLEGSILTLGRFWAAAAFALLARDAWSSRQRAAFEALVLAVSAGQSVFFMKAALTQEGPLLLLPGNLQYVSLWIALSALGVASSSKGPSWLRAGFFLLLTAGAVLSGNRSVLAALGAGLLLIAHRRWGWRGAAALLSAAALAAALLPSGGMERLLKSADPAAWKRLDIWTAAWRGILSRPWLGWGPGQFEGLYRLHAVPQAGLLRFDHDTLFAHNDYLQLAAAAGLPALACLLWGLWGLFSSAGPGAASTATAVFSFFNFPFALPVNGLVAGAVAAADGGRGAPSSPRCRALGRALGSFLLGLSACLAALLPRSFEDGPPERFFYGRAAVLTARADALLSAAGGDPSAYAKAEGPARAAVSACPGRAEAWRVLAAAEGPRSPSDAEASLRRALSLRPRDAMWRLDLALAEEYRGDRRAAREDLHEALRTEPNFAEAAFHLGRLMRLDGETAKARRWLVGLAQRRPSVSSAAPLSPYARRVLAWDEGAVRAEIALCRSDGKDIISRER